PYVPEHARDVHERIQPSGPEFAAYIQRVKRIDYHVRNRPAERPPAVALFAEGLEDACDRLEPRLTPVACTKGGAIVAFTLWLSAVRGNSNQSSGPITWLPPSTELSRVDSVNLLLANLGVAVGAAPPPAWVTQYK